MCEFKDMNGDDLNPGDKIELWQPSYHDWRNGVVKEKLTKMDRQLNPQTNEYESVLVTTIKTSATHNWLRSSKNIRKVV